MSVPGQTRSFGDVGSSVCLQAAGLGEPEVRSFDVSYLASDLVALSFRLTTTAPGCSR
jgi:hypothetical protein